MTTPNPPISFGKASLYALGGMLALTFVIGPTLHYVGGSVATDVVGATPRMRILSQQQFSGVYQLNVQSEDERDFIITSILINNKEKCTEATFMIDAYRPPRKLTLGDTYILLVGCDPVKVEIGTNLGHIVYQMHDAE